MTFGKDNIVSFVEVSLIQKFPTREDLYVILLYYLGTCGAANITECCVEDLCLGEPQDCYCDLNCHFFADCCQDIGDICEFGQSMLTLP